MIEGEIIFFFLKNKEFATSDDFLYFYLFLCLASLFLVY